MSTVDKLNKVLETKQAIKEAIESKGQIVGDVFADYPAAIQNIEGGGGSGTFVVPGGMRFAYSKIEKFPENWDWSEFEKETDFGDSFYNCKQLTSFPVLSLQPTSSYRMFYGNNYLKSIDISNWDFSNTTTVENMFYDCTRLRKIEFGDFDTSKVTNFRGLFNSCSKLTNIPKIDCSASTQSYSKTYSPIKSCSGLRDFGGLEGMNKSWYADEAYSLSYESLLNIINGLASGVSGQTLYLHQDLVDQLSDDDIAIATNKGWSISPAKKMSERVTVTSLSQIPTSTYKITPRTYDVSQFADIWGTSTVTKIPAKSSLYYFEGDLSSTTDATGMFNGCQQVRYATLSNTGNIASMAYMFNGATQLLEVYIDDISNVTAMNCMFKTCRDIDTITMKGNPSKLNVVTDMFKDTTTVGTFYYDDRYDYSKIIAVLPSTWTAVPITV